MPKASEQPGYNSKRDTATESLFTMVLLRFFFFHPETPWEPEAHAEGSQP
jgi:hypothetical protein